MRSQLIPVLALIWLLPPSAAHGQDGLRLSPARLPDVAGWLLVDQDVERRDVRRPVGVDSDIYLMRLFELSEIGGCEGTDAACRRRYALVIATGGMPGDVAVYDLGSVGEITEIAWVSSPRRPVISGTPPTLGYSDDATVEITVQNYPTSILAGDRSLIRTAKRYRLLINLQRLAVEELR